MFRQNETFLSEILLRGFFKYNFEHPLRRISLKDFSFGRNIFSYTTLILLAHPFCRHLPTSGRNNTDKNVRETPIYIHILNRECVTIP